MIIIPLNMNVVIRRTPAKEMSASGLIITANAQPARDRGMIIALSTESKLVVGMEVLIALHAGQAVNVGDCEYVIVNETSILGILQEGAER